MDGTDTANSVCDQQEICLSHNAYPLAGNHLGNDPPRDTSVICSNMGTRTIIVKKEFQCN
jgi:hypothetical protein